MVQSSGQPRFTHNGTGHNKPTSDGLCETKRWPKQHSEVRRTRETHLKREYGYLHPHRLGAVLNSRPPIRPRRSRELESLQEPNKKKPGHVLPKKWRAKDGEDEEEVDWAVERGRSGRAVGRFGFGGNEVRCWVIQARRMEDGWTAAYSRLAGRIDSRCSGVPCREQPQAQARGLAMPGWLGRPRTSRSLFFALPQSKSNHVSSSVHSCCNEILESAHGEARNNQASTSVFDTTHAPMVTVCAVAAICG